MADGAVIAVIGLSAAIIGLSWLGFRHLSLGRPPIGVMDLGDVAFVIVAIALMPFLYLALPPVVATLLLTVAMTAILAVVCGALLPSPLGLVAALGIALADVAVSALGPSGGLAIVVNDLVVGLAVVGVANIWAQGGMRAAHLVVLAAALTVYDVLATTVLTQTGDLMARLSGLPFAPIVAWPQGAAGGWLGIGVGDLLVASTFAIVFRRAYGRTAGLAAGASAIVCVALLLGLAELGIIAGTFPVMVILGPVIVIEHRLQRDRRGAERTTYEYLAAEPIGPARGAVQGTPGSLPAPGGTDHA